MVNFVIMERVKELTEIPVKFRTLRKILTSWQAIAITAVIFLTLKSAAEQPAMLFIRN